MIFSGLLCFINVRELKQAWTTFSDDCQSFERFHRFFIDNAQFCGFLNLDWISWG